MSSQRSRSPFWRNRALVLTLLLLGAALRLAAPGQIPPGLYHDEAQHGLDALRVLAGRFPLYFTANNGREPLFIYLVTACVGLLGRTPLAIRLPSFFIGVLTLAATYDFARVLFGEKIGRWSLAVLTVTFWHLHLSRVGFRAILLPLFSALCLAQAARAVKTRRSRYWIAAGAFYGASWYTYTAVRFTPVALVVFVGYALLCHREEALSRWRGALLFCGAALLALAPLGIYTGLHPEIILGRSGQVSVFSPEINGGNPWGLLLHHAWRTAEMFFLRGDRIWRHNLAWRPVWGPALGLAFVTGVGVALARFRRDASAALVLLWITVMAVPTLLAEDAPHFLRAVGILPVVALLPALGLDWLQARLNARHSHSLPRVLLLLPALLWGMELASTTTDYFIHYAEAPLAYHWFEAGPVALAGEINTLRDAGWDGAQMLHGPKNERIIYLDAQLWDSWTAIPFLVPQEKVRFLPAEKVTGATSQAFIVWPYRDWVPEVWPLIAHPAYLRVREGPQSQGDKEPEPTTIALIIQVDPVPEIPVAVAHFKAGLTLHAALVTPEEAGARVQLWWRAESAPAAEYIVFVHYLRDGEQLEQHDSPPGGGQLPTTRWQAGDLILDEHFLPGVQPDPARDTLRIGLYRRDNGAGLAVLDEAGNPAGGWIEQAVILSQ
ncbi:MAG: glycosyltransferase family 39 protein [Anaerolineae bacterium]|nr:glycosyltransferase family 39 protein [Anaerolineae bacterium]